LIGFAFNTSSGSAANLGIPKPPERGIASLKTVPVPGPTNLGDFVQDHAAAVQLGKALFWDVQVGSDGATACATCHYQAGADPRTKNQVAPGPDNTFQLQGPNGQLGATDFPLHKLSDPNNPATVVGDKNDIVGSQGVFNGTYTGKRNGKGVELVPTGPGAIFQVNGVQVRNVEPRNVPTVVNAIFNHRNFWDSRARSEYNGQDPIGKLDPTALVVEVVRVRGLSTGAFLHPVRIESASLASQAVGPPLSDVEMSYGGRRFADLGRKMLSTHLQPLAYQRVAVDDGVLGPLSRQRLRAGAKGIMARYADLVEAAFQPQWWDGGPWMVDLSRGAPALRRTTHVGPNVFTVAEYNFPLFFGLAVAEYEKTLVANDTPFDRFMDGDNAALSPSALRGFQLYLGRAGCFECHGGPELSNAAVTNIKRRGLLTEPEGESIQGDLLERMVMANGEVHVYDTGHYNIGVRPTAEDLGIGARIGPQNLPLSNARRFEECLQDKTKRGMPVETARTACQVPRILARPFEASALLGDPPDVAAFLVRANQLIGPNDPLFFFESDPMSGSMQLFQARDLLLQKVADGTIPAELAPQVQKLCGGATKLLPDTVDPGMDPLNPLAPPLAPDEPVAADGSFKVPALRNVELTAPYFHNGGQATLEQVIDFYDRGGDFGPMNEAFDPAVRPLHLTDQERSDLVAFLKALTDERVRWDRAPFDHPSLSLPNGGTPRVQTMTYFAGVGVLDDRVELPETGARGAAVPYGTPRTAFANFLQPLQ
jgi:cytochrome c peroxidase